MNTDPLVRYAAEVEGQPGGVAICARFFRSSRRGFTSNDYLGLAASPSIRKGIGKRN